MSRGQIVALRVFSARLPMRIPFAHHRATRRESRPQIVEVELDDGTRGYGEAQPRAYVSGETEASVREMVEESFAPWLVGQYVPDLGAAAALLAGRRAAMLREAVPAAVCAIDLALLDAAGQRTRRSAAEVLGGLRRAGLPSDGAVVGMMPAVALRLFAAQLRKRGKRWIKVKVGGADDASTLETLRSVLGPRIELTLDANAAWSRDEAVARIDELSRFGIAGVEQPVKREDVEGLVEVAERTGVPVIADESLCTRQDALSLIRHSPRIQWHLRVGKCGGLIGMLDLLRLASAHGVACHLGVMVGETALLRAAGRLVAGATLGLQRIESDEGLLLARDLAVHATARADEGWVEVPDGPGLGVTIDVDALRAACAAPDRDIDRLRDLPISA